MYKEGNLKEKWKLIISKVSKSYIVRTKMLFYGFASVVVFELIYPFINNDFSFRFIYEEGFIYEFIFMGLFSFLIGLFYGFFMWSAFDNKKVKL